MLFDCIAVFIYLCTHIVYFLVVFGFVCLVQLRSHSSDRCQNILYFFFRLYISIMHLYTIRVHSGFHLKIYFYSEFLFFWRQRRHIEEKKRTSNFLLLLRIWLLFNNKLFFFLLLFLLVMWLFHCLTWAQKLWYFVGNLHADEKKTHIRKRLFALRIRFGFTWFYLLFFTYSIFLRPSPLLSSSAILGHLLHRNECTNVRLPLYSIRKWWTTHFCCCSCVSCFFLSS